MTKLVEKFEGDTPSGQKTDAEQFLGSMPDFEEHMRKMRSDDVVLEGNNLGKVKAKFKELSARSFKNDCSKWRDGHRMVRYR